MSKGDEMYYIDDYEKNLLKKGSSKSTVSAYLADLDDFESYLKQLDKPLEKAKEEDFISYSDLLSNNGKSAATINRRISSIRSFYDYLIKRGAIKKNPCINSKASKIEEKEIKWLSEEKINKLVESPASDTSGKRDRAILELMYATGIRVSELCGLNVSDINLNIGYISVNTNDNKKARVVPIGRYCKAALKEYLEDSRKALLGKKEDKGALFLSYLGERITRQAVWKLLKTYGEKCELGEEVTPQLIRDTFAVHLIQHGADLKSLQELLGHEDIMATKIYLKFKKTRVMDVYNNSFPRA